MVKVDLNDTVKEQQTQLITAKTQEQLTNHLSVRLPYDPPVEAESSFKDIELDTSKSEAAIRARDLARASGDMKVYKYYFRSIGTAKLAHFVAFVLLNVFSSSFSRKLLSHLMVEHKS